MFPVSADYKAQINKAVRNLSFLRVTFGVIDPDAVDDSTLTASSETFYSNTGVVDESIPVAKKYMTMEHNRFVLDGTNLLCPEVASPTPEYQGYVSNVISDENGEFAVNPILTVTFTELFQFIGLSFTFDTVMNSYPTEMIIRAYNGASLIYTNTVNPTSSEFTLEQPVPTAPDLCNKIEIEFVSTFPVKRRACMEYLAFGLLKRFNDTEFYSSTWKREYDLVSTKISTNDFDFTLIDKDLQYHPENPDGIYRYIEKNQPVVFEYGYELNNGAIEWVHGGTSYTTGGVDVDVSNKIPLVKFKSSDRLNQLDDIWYGGVYNETPVTLYSLASEILTVYDIPFVLGADLNNVSTKMPLPEVKVKECLQLIANAGRCVIYTDRDGAVNIKRQSLLEDDDFVFDYTNIKNAPILSKYPVLSSVDTFYMQVTNSNSPTIVHESTLDSATPIELLLKYNKTCTDLSLILNGVSVVGTANFYANSCVVTLQGTGTIKVLGSPLAIVKQGVSYFVSDTGFNCPIENQLLTNITDAEDFAEWIASILVLRNEYSIDDRGYPELDLGDGVTVDTSYSTDLPAIVTATTISYNGGLSATTKYISKEV